MNLLVNSLLAVVSIMPLTETIDGTSYSPTVNMKGDYQVLSSYNNGYNIEIVCAGHHLDDLIDMEINVYEVSRISASRCLFSPTMNVQNILHSMGINNSLYISFKTFGNIINRFNFRNLSILELALADSTISEIPYDLFYDTQNLREISISDTNIDHVPKDFFNVWAQNLLKVGFINNKLQKISRGDFDALINVEDLDLTQNHVNEIELGAFDKLTQLLRISLTKNRLQILPPGIFNRLVNLTEFFLDSLEIDYYVEDNSENGIEFLAMHQLTNLPANALKGLYKVETIKFVGHNLEELPLGLFDDHKSLVLLNIENNGLKFLPVGIFKELKSLVKLYISKNQLTSFMPELFIGLHSLEIFNATMNNLTRIDVHFLKYSKRMKQIDLSFNQIPTFEYENGNQLQYQDISSNTNNIFEIPFFPQLELLNLISNKFTEFNVITFWINGYFNGIGQDNKNCGDSQSEFENQRYRKIVDLENNHISEVNLTGLYSTMPKIEKLNVTNMKSNKVVYIYLSNNPLLCDCNLVDFIRYLNGSTHQDLKKYWMILAKEKSNFGEEFSCSSPPELENRDVRKIYLEEFHCLIQTNAFGNTCIDTCVCVQYPEKRFLSIDCSFRNLTQLPEIKNSMHNWSIALNMSGNALQGISSVDTSYFANITDLDLSSNSITDVSLNVFSPNLRLLKLHNNSISRFGSNIIEYLASDNPLSSLMIHNNKWVCECETHKVFQSSISKKLSNYNFHELVCYGTNRKLYEVTVDELCKDTIVLIVSMSLFIACFGIIVSSLAALYYRYQKQIKIWLYSKQLCLWFVTEDELDKDKKYDAFVSFSHKDEGFVEKEIIAELESGPRPFKLCLHYRDWLAGEWIPWQISRSVADSRRTIIILSPNFLESVWGLMEFRAAHTQALEEGRTRLIVIVYGELNNLDDHDEELKDYLGSNTYIKWGDPWFWQKLKYALPHRSRNFSVMDNCDTVRYFGTVLRSHFSSIASHPSSE